MKSTAEERTVEGACHCGRIRFAVSFPPERITICNCSICRRYNAAWGYYRRREVALEIRDDAASSYQWNECVISFRYCRHCGCVTHYDSLKESPDSRLALNFRMVDPALWEDIPVRYFDGADTFRELP